MNKKKICLALGFFDSVHIGHRKILSSVKKLSEKYDAEPTAMTFSNNIYGLVKKGEKLIYLFDERTEIFENLGVTPISFAFTDRFRQLDENSFLKMLLDSYDIKAFVCGKDFTFGKGRGGNSQYLKEYSISKGIETVIEDDVCLDGKKISTTLIKKYLPFGKNLKFVNDALGDNYFITGSVENGMGRGNGLGFPTANINLPNEKFLIGEGVYSTETVIDGVKYKSITNVGPKPTFNEDDLKIETHLIDFNENIYGKRIKVIFCRFMRDIIYFKDKNELINQLKEDRKTRCSE